MPVLIDYSFFGMFKMLSHVKLLATSFLVLSHHAYSRTECIADLGRINQSYCAQEEIDDISGKVGSIPDSPPSYSWKINSAQYRVEGVLCDASSSREMIFVLDRSSSMGNANKIKTKNGQNIDKLILSMIDTYLNSMESQSVVGAKLGILIGSDFGDCREYIGEEVNIKEEVPCYYVPAREISRNSAQMDLIMSLLNDFNGKFAQGSQKSAGVTPEALDLAASEKMGLSVFPNKKSVLVMTDGRIYESQSDGEIFPELRVLNYKERMRKVKQKIASLADRGLHTSIAFMPSDSIWFGEIYRESIETLCSIEPKIHSECGFESGKLGKPESWEINSLDPRKELSNFYDSYFGSKNPNVIKLVQNVEDLEVLMTLVQDKVKQFNFPNRVTFSVNGSSERDGVIDGIRFSLGNMPIEFDGKKEQKIVVNFDRNGRKTRFTINSQISFEEKILNNKSSEMFCPSSDNSLRELSRLRGGGVRCGVVMGAYPSSDHHSMGHLILFIPALLLLIFRGNRKIFFLFCVLFSLMFDVKATAQVTRDNQGGSLIMNANSHGVGLPSKTMIRKERFNSGLYLDYADSPLTISDKKNSDKKNDVISRMIVIHLASEVRLFEETALTVHVPYVTNNSMKLWTSEDSSEDTPVRITNNVGKVTDITLGIKWNFYKKGEIAVSSEPSLLMPSGEQDKLIGEKHEVYGFNLLTSFGVDQAGRSSANSYHANIGYYFRSPSQITDVRAEGLNLKNYVQGKLSYERSLNVGIVGAVFSNRYQQDSSGLFSAENPVELGVFGIYKFSTLISVSGGYSKGIGDGIGAAEQRIWNGLNLVF